MNFNFVNTLSESEKKSIWELLCICNKEFLPALSSRKSTSQKDLFNIENTNDPIDYYKKLVNQYFIIAKSGDKIVGFLSFIHNFHSENLKKYSPSNYITTVCIFPEFRGHGISTQLYKYVENNLPKKLFNTFLTIRTWSTNKIQRKILQKFNYINIKEILEDRGKGISTIYYCKELMINQKENKANI